MFGAFVVQFWANHDDIGVDCLGREWCSIWSNYLQHCIGAALKEMGR